MFLWKLSQSHVCTWLYLCLFGRALGSSSGDAKLSPRGDASPTNPPIQKQEEEEDDLYDDLYGGLTENTGDAKGDGKGRGSGDGDQKMGEALEEGTVAAAAGGKVGNEGVEGKGEVDGGMREDISTRAVMNSLKVMWRDIAHFCMVLSVALWKK